jgi:anti-sigma factor RsiW
MSTSNTPSTPQPPGTQQPELTCMELVELVTAYLEDTLARGDRSRFEEHLMACEGCSTYLDQMRRTIRLVGSLSEGAIPTDARDALLHAFQGWKANR